MRSAEKHDPAAGGSHPTGTGTQTSSTSPMPSPRPHRRHHHHHHHHHHHNHQSGSTSAHGEPEQVGAGQLEQQQRKARRAGGGAHGTASHGWYGRHGKSQDSGRSSDSSTLSLSIGGGGSGSAKRSDNKLAGQGGGGGGGGSLTSPLRGTPSAGRRTLDPPPLEFGIGSTASTPLSSRKKANNNVELSRQRSLDSETAPIGSTSSSTSTTTPTPIRSKPGDLFYRDGSLSRSLSFMQQRRPTAVSLILQFNILRKG